MMIEITSTTPTNITITDKCWVKGAYKLNCRRSLSVVNGRKKRNDHHPMPGQRCGIDADQARTHTNEKGNNKAAKL